MVSAKSNLDCKAGCGVMVSWSDAWSDHARIAQYSVMLEDDTCGAAHCK